MGKRRNRRSKRKKRQSRVRYACAGLLLVIAMVVVSGGGALGNISRWGGNYDVRGPNELSATRLDQIFRAYGSRLRGKTVFDLGVATGLNGIYFAAFALKETSLAETGVGAGYNNPTGTECDPTLCESCAPGNNRSWCDFATLDQGTAAWFYLISRAYITGKIDDQGVPLTTPYLIACGSNGQGKYLGSGGCAAYADKIQAFVDGWRSGKLLV